jgi:hypothetical protein
LRSVGGGCGAPIDIIKRERKPLQGGVSNEPTRYVWRDGLAFVFVMPHIALRAANTLGQGSLGYAQAGSYRFNGVHEKFLAALRIYIITNTNCKNK